MSLHFRHYKEQSRTGRRDLRLGVVLYDKNQPTLDILFGKHVFVMFWMRKNR